MEKDFSFLSNKGKNIRILLLKPPLDTTNVYGSLSDFSSVSAPEGLCYIAALLRKEGYKNISILDAEAEALNIKSTIEKIQKYNPSIVGVTCMSATIVSAHNVIKETKKIMPNVLYIAGGPHVTAIPKETLDEFPLFDLLVVGEGEITFKEVLETLNIEGSFSSFEKIKGIAFSHNGKKIVTPRRERIKNLDDLPLPAYDMLPKLKTHYWPYMNNIQGHPAFSIMVSRGCPYKCRFCDRSVFGNIFTKHSPEFVVDLIENMVKKHGIKYLLFDDDNFLLDKKYLLEILDLLEKRKLRVPFTCESRVDTIDDERLFRLKKAGCKEIMFGMESGSSKMLKLMGKNIVPDQIRNAVAMTKKYGIDTLGYFMFGYPGETEETMKETLELVKEIKLFDIVAQPFIPFPGSDIYQFALENGSYVEGFSYNSDLTKIVYVANGLTRQKIAFYLNQCYDACYKNLRTYLSFYKRIYSFRHLKVALSMFFRGDLWEID